MLVVHSWNYAQSMMLVRVTSDGLTHAVVEVGDPHNYVDAVCTQILGSFLYNWRHIKDTYGFPTCLWCVAGRSR